MIPILIVIVVAIAGFGAAVALNWDKIIKALKGKKLAVLGQVRVGKTRLIRFLTEGSIPEPEEYDGTQHPKKVRGRRFELRDLKLAIKDTWDMPARMGYDWERIIKGADIVLYLLRVDRLMEGYGPTESRVQKDIGQIKRWLDANPKKFPLFVALLHESGVRVLN